MFLASEAGTQLCEVGLGLDRTPAVFLGSLGSGYLTGSFAALAEWRKVLGATSGATQQASHRRYRQLDAPDYIALVILHTEYIEDRLNDSTARG
jgi:hypothetical protein